LCYADLFAVYQRKTSFPKCLRCLQDLVCRMKARNIWYLKYKSSTHQVSLMLAKIRNRIFVFQIFSFRISVSQIFDFPIFSFQIFSSQIFVFPIFGFRSFIFLIFGFQILGFRSFVFKTQSKITRSRRNQ